MAGKTFLCNICISYELCRYQYLGAVGHRTSGGDSRHRTGMCGNCWDYAMVVVVVMVVVAMVVIVVIVVTVVMVLVVVVVVVVIVVVAVVAVVVFSIHVYTTGRFP